MNKVESNDLIAEFMGVEAYASKDKLFAHTIQKGEDEGMIFMTDEEAVKYHRDQIEGGDPDVSDEFILDEAYTHGYLDGYAYIPYHDSWSLLMPVVNKCMDVQQENHEIDMEIRFGYDEGICSLRTKDNTHTNPYYDVIICEKNKGKETIYKTVVRFIQW
jgi:hypothetical protein